MQETSIQFSGEAGEGIATAGDLLMQTCAHMGFEATCFKSFPSNIKGGYSSSLVKMAEAEIISPLSHFDILFALNAHSFSINRDRIRPADVVVVESAIMADTGIKEQAEALVSEQGVCLYQVPFSALARETLGMVASKNMIVLGAAAFLLNIPLDCLGSRIEKRFLEKAGQYRHALEVGANYLKDRKIAPSPLMPHDGADKETKAKRILLEGNKAVSLGALAAGCNFMSLYPITPATTIGQYLTEPILSNNGSTYQAEDEIAALGAVIGASFAGAKSMTITSGPGLSLMQEMLGYASMVELPIVIIDVQRGGPSTGMPTKHDQADLFAAAFGGHGESQRIILAATNVRDNIFLTIQAFNLSEKYQCPVILLSDTSLALIKQTIEWPDLEDVRIINRTVFVEDDLAAHKEYKRYAVSASGLNPISIPGFSPKTYIATSVEHDEDSSPRHTPEIRSRQMAKRFRKLDTLQKDHADLMEFDLEGIGKGGKADAAVIAWGLTAAITKEAVARLRKKGHKIAALYPRLLYPLCVEAIKALTSYSDRLFIPESNYLGQYAKLIKMHLSVDPIQFNISRGEPFYPEEIADELEAILNKSPRGDA